MTFYDYELGYGRDGSWHFVLCAGGKPLVGGTYCRISKAGDNCCGSARRAIAVPRAASGM